MDRAPRVLLGVSGGIAAYKAPEIVRAFVKAGVEVQVVMTPSARAFTTEMALSTVSRRPVRVELLDASEEGQVGHIELADWPDLVVVAPATANLPEGVTGAMTQFDTINGGDLAVHGELYFSEEGRGQYVHFFETGLANEHATIKPSYD